MPRVKKEVKKKVESKLVKPLKKEEKEIVIDIDKIILPLSIFIAGLLIALSIFLTNNGSKESNTTGSDTAGATDTTDTAAQDESPAAKTVIGNSPYIGDIKKAKVALVEYTDLQCPYCQRHATETEPQIVSEYVDTGKIIYVVRSFPLVSLHGELATQSANAVLCVNELGGRDKFYEFYKQAFAKASVDELAKVAQSVGVNMNKYNTCMSENRYKDQIDKELAEGGNAGVQGTPGFVIGVLDKDGNVDGKLIAGAYPYESFKAIIDEMLAK
jgi:protein-disulfide isomerase